MIFELLKFVIKKKKYWLIPALIAFLLVGTLIILTQSSAIAPMIYTIF
jgi:hypothetical protein